MNTVVVFVNYVIQTSDLSKTVKGMSIVSRVNLNVRKGEIYGLLGPNGAGKTTIMKMLTGLILPTSGAIMLFGKNFSETSKEGLKRVGSIIEYPIFFEHMTAMENLQIHCEYLGYYDKRAIRQALTWSNWKESKIKSEGFLARHEAASWHRQGRHHQAGIDRAG